MILCPVILTCITTNTWYVTVCIENNVCRWTIDIDHILPANQECVVRTRKGSAGKRSKYIDRNNKVAIFCDAWAKWHQIYSGGAFHSGEATYKIWRRLLQPFLRYEHSNQNFLLFCTLCGFRYSSHMHASIWLKFGTRNGDLKANSWIKFKINSINIGEVESNFMHKTKLNFCQKPLWGTNWKSVCC